MALSAAVPLALAESHTVIKGEKGPNASAISWEYVPDFVGVWKAHITNNGLRSLVVDVYDSTTGTLDQIMHQRIRFAAYDQYPTGVLDSQSVVMSPIHKYTITVTPNGPRGSSCIVDDVLTPPSPPIAKMKVVSVNHMDVAVADDGSSDADGTIVSWDWSFGDGGVASGMSATHTYTAKGTYTITLTVTDNDGLTGSASASVDIVDNPPVADFSFTVTGASVAVDAGASSDDYGIVSYAWNWGDGMSESSASPTASHTYSAPPVPVVGPTSVQGRPPGFPYPTFVFVYMPDGVTPVLGADVKVTNSRTGYVFSGLTDEYGFVQFDANAVEGGGCLDGDILSVVATYGTMTGTSSAVVDWINAGNAIMNITLGGVGPVAHDYTVTLTVTDALGQTSSISKLVTVYW